MKWMLILVLALSITRAPEPPVCVPPACDGVLICADTGCDCACFPGGQ